MKENEEEEVSNELRKVWSGLRIESQKVFSFFPFFLFLNCAKIKSHLCESIQNQFTV